MKKNMLSAKRDFAAVVHDGVLYTVGGIDDESECMTPRRTSS
jgi:hypothetical protein